MAEVTMVQALNEALRFCLQEDRRVLIFGEDVGTLGGVFRVTDRLQAEFGEGRVFDTPLAESAIVGFGLGLTLARWRPVVEMQFDGFSYPALDQIFSHVAKYHFRSQGRLRVEMVIRIPFGGGIKGVEHHSESPETYYTHTAGLKVVVPSAPLDAYNLLVRSVRDPDPVIFLAPKSRYWAKEAGELTADGEPIGKARVVRQGSHATLISWGGIVHRCLEAAQAAAEDGRPRGGGPPFTGAARCRSRHRVRGEDGPGRRGPRGPAHLGIRRRGGRTDHGERLRAPRRPRAPRDGVRHALPSGPARGLLPARRRPDPPRGRSDVEVLDPMKVLQVG